jgi:hypothetical protein
MNFFQAGFSRLTDRELETITAVGVCQLKFAEFRNFFLGKTPKKFQMGRNQIACIWLLVSGHWSLVTGRWSLATSTTLCPAPCTLSYFPHSAFPIPNSRASVLRPLSSVLCLLTSVLCPLNKDLVKPFFTGSQNDGFFIVQILGGYQLVEGVNSMAVHISAPLQDESSCGTI